MPFGSIRTVFEIFINSNTNKKLHTQGGMRNKEHQRKWGKNKLILLITDDDIVVNVLNKQTEEEPVEVREHSYEHQFLKKYNWRICTFWVLYILYAQM